MDVRDYLIVIDRLNSRLEEYAERWQGAGEEEVTIDEVLQAFDIMSRTTRSVAKASTIMLQRQALQLAELDELAREQGRLIKRWERKAKRWRALHGRDRFIVTNN